MTETQKRLLEYAVRRLGRAQLAARLKVPETTLDAWLEAREELSNTKKLLLADVVAALDRQK